MEVNGGASGQRRLANSLKMVPVAQLTRGEASEADVWYVLVSAQFWLGG